MTDTPPTRDVIVFGGAGFIGTHLLRELAAAGRGRLVAADIAPPPTLIDGVEHLAVDVREPITVEGEFDVVYNLAAVHRTPGHPDHEYYDTNVLGAINVTDFCRERGVDELVFTSSISVYGPSEDRLDESSPLRPTSAYGRSKQMAEAVHRTWRAEDERRRLVVVRPAVTFGPGEGGNFERLLKSLRSRTFVYPGRTDTIKSCGHVSDLVGSIEWALDLPDREPTFNFAYPERTTIAMIAETIAEVAGLRAPRTRVPLSLMRAAAGVTEMIRPLSAVTGVNRARIMKLVESTNVAPGFLVERGYPYRTDLRSGVERWLDEARAATA